MAFCLSGTCPTDATTLDYVQQRTDADFEPVHADAGASYAEEYRIDVSKLEPLVAAPHSPDNRKTAQECSSTPIDRVYIGLVFAPISNEFRRPGRMHHDHQIIASTVYQAFPNDPMSIRPAYFAGVD